MSMMLGFGHLMVTAMMQGGNRSDELFAVAIVTGLLASVLCFLLEVGSVNRQGLAGMGDLLMVTIMAETALGDGTVLRIVGFLLLAAALFPLRYATPVLWSGWRRLMVISAGVCFAASFAVLGHAAGLAWSGRVAVMVHVSAVAFWVGSLFPLWLCCRDQPAEKVADLLRRFGDLARWLVLAMLLSGGVLLWLLIGVPPALTDSTYVMGLLLKLVLVMWMLGLGAWHRYRLVPALMRHAAGHAGVSPAMVAMRRSITIEGGIAFLVLLVTVVVTGNYSPPG
ncbi:MAG: copper resistance D family protein [Pseudomonadota bacterium]